MTALKKKKQRIMEARQSTFKFSLAESWPRLQLNLIKIKKALWSPLSFSAASPLLTTIILIKATTLETEFIIFINKQSSQPIL